MKQALVKILRFVGLRRLADKLSGVGGGGGGGPQEPL